MNRLFMFQAIYVVLGLTFNSVSLVRVVREHRPLAPTRMDSAIIFFVAYIGALFAVALGLQTIYRLLMIPIAILMLFGGMIAHVKNGPSSRYASPLSWFAAIAINSFGLVVTIEGIVAH